MNEKVKRKKVNSKWRKGGDRSPTADEKRAIFDGAYEKPGFHRGAKVYKK